MNKTAVGRLSMVASEMIRQGKDVSFKKLKKAYIKRNEPQGKPFDIKGEKARLSRKKARAKRREMKKAA